MGFQIQVRLVLGLFSKPRQHLVSKPKHPRKQKGKNRREKGKLQRQSLEVLDAGAWHKRTTKEKRLAKKRRILADKEELKAYRATSSGSKGKSEGKGDCKGGLKAKDQARDDLCFSWDAAKGPCAEPGEGCKGKVKRIHKCESA